MFSRHGGVSLSSPAPCDDLAFAQTEIRDAYRTEERKPRTLRLVVFNTASPGGASPNEPPHWTLHVHGKLLDEEPPGGGATPPLTALVDRITVQLDPAHYPGDAGLVTWSRNRSVYTHPATWPQGKDQFSMKRPGTGPVKCIITLQLAHAPERMVLPPPMAQLLDMRTGARMDVIHALWLKIRDMGALSHHDASLVDVNERLGAALRLAPGQVPFPQVVSAAMSQLTPTPPIVLHYTIRTDGTQRCVRARLHTPSARRCCSFCGVTSCRLACVAGG